MLRSLALALASAALASAANIVLSPLDGKSGTEVALVLLPGVDHGFQAAQYQALGEAAQASSTDSLWVAVADLDSTSTSDRTSFDSATQGAIAAMLADGMDASTPVFYAGHSDAGTMLEQFAFDDASSFAGVALLGAFIPRAHYAADTTRTVSSTEGSYPVPTLTVAGELDGVARLTRAAVEPLFKQILLAQDRDQAVADFPVVLLEGVSHVQLADGNCSSTDLLRQDLKPEVDQATATAAVADALAAFLAAQSASAPSTAALSALVSATETFAAPLLEVLEYDGYEHFFPSCNSDFPTNPDCGYTMWPNEALPPGPVPAPSPALPEDCTCGSSWVMEHAQEIMSGFDQTDKPQMSATTADAYHDVSDVHPFHLPHIFNDCADDDGSSCKLNTTTVTMPFYEEATAADDAVAPVSVLEFRTKLKSRQAMWQAAGLTADSSNDTDATDFNICASINQASLDLALSKASDAALARYHAVGEQYVIGDDSEAPIGLTGPEWIANRLIYERVDADGSNVGTQVQVRSWSFTIENYNEGNVPWIVTAGYHYCKLLSPSRVLEWIYVDSLRAYNSAAPSDWEDSQAQCQTCLDKQDPLDLSATSSWCWIDQTCYTVGDKSNPCLEGQCASQASLSECVCDACNQLTCSM